MTASVNLKFVARQAILDRNEKVFAYELLYRNSKDNFFPADISDDTATARLFFDSLLFYGTDNLGDSKKVFINLSTRSILADLPKLIAPNNIVLEIIERTKLLEQVFPKVKNLLESGYIFALDDYDSDPKWNDLLQTVKYIKLEVEENIESTLERIITLKKQFPEKLIIVERIEDYASFDLIKGAGADFFQGYYFTKPKVLNFKNVNPSQLTVLDLLKVILQAPLDFKFLISKVEKDAALVVRLLRLCNLRCKSSNKK